MDVRLLGPLEAGPSDDPVRIAASKPRSLLATLALHPGREVSTDTLTETLWGEEPPPSAGKLLQTYVSQLRRLLPADLPLVTRAPGYALDVAADRIDTVQFAQLVAAGGQARSAGSSADAAVLLRQALDLWRGEALSDVGPALLFDAETARLGELRLRAFEDLYAVRLELGEAPEVLAALQVFAAAHPLREGLQELLVLALYQCGRQAEALAAYDVTRAWLRDELGLDPGPGLRDLHARLLRHEPGLQVDRPARAGSLPTPLTTTLGRERELEALDRLLAESATRLVTLTGPGGSGKTRLALVAATRAQEHYRDGAVLVPLEAVREPALVLTTVAAALGVRESGDDPVATLTRALARRQLLVVLDNLEQAVAVGPALGELLAALPGLTLLVTSRVLLAISGEHAFPVSPLVLPETAADVADSPAVALFVERAQAALPSFEVTVDNAADVAELCRRLDGLPLALELAAAQSRTLTPTELLARLGSRLDAPGPGARDRPARHQSLRSALDGSYELLTPAARDLFAALSVFVGGFELPAAEAVCAATLGPLAELVDSSLVSTTGHRFTMLETIREFAAERLSDAVVVRRHNAYFLDLAESANAELDGARQAERLGQLSREHDNLRASFAGLRETGDREGELRLAVALARFWYIRGHLTESRTRLSEALARAAALPPRLQADALRKVSANAVLRGDYVQALELAEQALAIYDELGDALGRARSLSNIGAIAHASGAVDRAAASLDEAIVLATDLGAERVLALALNNRGDLCLTYGEYDEATRLFTESRALLEAQGDTINVARSLLNLALSALGRRVDGEAAGLVSESLSLCAKLGDIEDVAWCLLARASVVSRTERFEEAALLLGAAESVLREMDAVLKPYERSLHAATTSALVEALGVGDFARHLARGNELPLADAVAIALSNRRTA